MRGTGWAVLLAVVVALLLVLALVLQARYRRREREQAQAFHVALVVGHLAHGGFETRDPLCPLCQMRVRWDPEVRALVERLA